MTFLVWRLHSKGHRQQNFPQTHSTLMNLYYLLPLTKQSPAKIDKDWERNHFMRTKEWAQEAGQFIYSERSTCSGKTRKTRSGYSSGRGEKDGRGEREHTPDWFSFDLKKQNIPFKLQGEARPLFCPRMHSTLRVCLAVVINISVTIPEVSVLNDMAGCNVLRFYPSTLIWEAVDAIRESEHVLLET